MNHQKSLYELTFEELDRELIARGAQKMKEGGIEFYNPDWPPEQNEMMERIGKMYQSASPPNTEMRGFSDQDLVKRLKELSRGQKKEDTDDKHNRGIIEEDDRMDFYELEEVLRANDNTRKAEVRKFLNVPRDTEDLEDIIDLADMEKLKKIKNNLDSTAMICLAKGLKIENGHAVLEVRSFKEAYNLCECERFADQPAVNANICTCFLVKEDVIATAGHFVEGRKIEDMRIVFGFKMENSCTAATIPKENIYNGVKLIGLRHERDGNAPDWALVKLDRKVKEQEIVKLSRDEISIGQPVYTIGHPAKLPLKFAAGASVRDTKDKFFFAADLDIFMGNSGSPVFDMNTHQVIGMVVHGYSKDFRWVDGCWISVIYPDPGENTQLSKCTRSSEFRELLVI
jgi:hypothetical protein